MLPLKQRCRLPMLHPSTVTCLTFTLKVNFEHPLGLTPPVPSMPGLITL